MHSVENGILKIEVDQTLYSRECVLRTAYWFTDRCYVFITRSVTNTLLVSLKAKAPTLDQPSSEPLELVAGEFCNSLLEHQLRQDIEAQTGKIRELIVAKALSESGIFADEPPGDVDDPVEEKLKLVNLRAGVKS
jgi:His-Xaa-Ser system protein HxsD